MQDYVTDLLSTIDQATPRLLALGAAASGRRPAAGKWSAREVIGHLIDSASNNHKRFVAAQGRDDLVFQGYDQEAWVERQRYQEAPWEDLVALWAAFNRHLARVMAAVPAEDLTRTRRTHNLHEIAWRPVPSHDPATLDYFMNDYVGHLHHHLRQVLGDGWNGTQKA